MWKPTPNRAEGAGAYRTIRRAAAGGLYRAERAGSLPFAPLAAFRRQRGSRLSAEKPAGGRGRNDFSRRVFRTRGTLALLPPLQRDSRSSWRRGAAGSEVSAGNKNLGRIGRIVQFYLPRCPPRNGVKTFTSSSLKCPVSRLTRPRVSAPPLVSRPDRAYGSSKISLTESAWQETETIFCI